MPARVKSTKTSAKKTSTKKPAVLAGGNPQIAKADGNAPVQAYIAAMPGWKREIGRPPSNDASGAVFAKLIRELD